jgi:hypothetical protein
MNTASRACGSRGWRWVHPGAVACVLAAALSAAEAIEERPAPALEEAIDASRAGNEAAAAAQAIIERLSDDADALAAEYRRTLHETQSLRVYKKQLEELLASQDGEIGSLQRQIEDAGVVSRQIMPLMLRMIDSLDDFVRLDVPFLPDERRQRVQGLRELMSRADVSLSEKYRRLLEAYQVENEYGRTIEAYRGTLAAPSGPRTVDFLRVGRVALLYQTLDGREAGFWDAAEGDWVALPGGYRSAVRQGLQIARKQVAPDLIRIPVRAPEEVAAP